MEGQPTSLRVRRHRAALRRAGLRPVQLWLPDTRRAGFAAECARQSRLLRNDVAEAELQRWLESVADTDGWR